MCAAKHAGKIIPAMRRESAHCNLAQLLYGKATADHLKQRLTRVNSNSAREWLHAGSMVRAGENVVSELVRPFAHGTPRAKKIITGYGER